MSSRAPAFFTLLLAAMVFSFGPARAQSTVAVAFAASQAGALAAVTVNGTSCGIAQSATSCSLNLTPGASVQVTLGYWPNFVATATTGICAGATIVSGQFSFIVPAAGGTCGLTTTSSASPQNGWWWSNDGSDTGYALQVDATGNYLYGVVFTYRADGSAVWYVINAVRDSATYAYTGTASELSWGAQLLQTSGGAARLKTIVANVSLTFTGNNYTGSLSWTPRAADGSASTAATVKSLYRYNLEGGNLSGSPTLPGNAPATGGYNVGFGFEDGRGYFIETQQGASANPTAYIGYYYYDASGNATWAVSQPKAPLVQSGGGWQLSAVSLLANSGGQSITSTGSTATSTQIGTITANLSATASNVNVTSGSSSTGALALRAYTVPAGNGPFFVQVANLNSANIAAPWITFLAGSNSTGAISYVDATSGAYLALAPNNSVALSQIAGGSLRMSSPGIGGNLYLSSAQLQTGATNTSCAPMTGQLAVTAPSPTSTVDCNINTRWQFIELGGVYDVTYINVFSVPLALNQGASSYGRATAAQIATLKSALGTLTGGGQIYPVGSQATSRFVRAISPANAGVSTFYPSLVPYVGNVFQNATALSNFNTISGTYSAAAPVAANTVCSQSGSQAFATQSYSVSSVSYSGNNLTINGTGGTVGPFSLNLLMPVSSSCAAGSTGQVSSCFSSAVTLADLSNMLYTNVAYYSSSYSGCQSGYAETNGSNDVFSVVVRDFLAGFAAGYNASTVAGPSGTAYGSMAQSTWWTTATKVFSGVQPTATAYNPWAAAIYTAFGNQVYGFQYSDRFSSASPLGNPQLSLQGAVPVQVVILAE